MNEFSLKREVYSAPRWAAAELPNVPTTRLRLGNLPTPLQHIGPPAGSGSGLETDAGAGDGEGGSAASPPIPSVIIKRDDLTGIGLSGNKVRKLDYLLAEATALLMKSAGAAEWGTPGHRERAASTPRVGAN